MRRADAEELARRLIVEFGIDRDGWTFAWNRRKSAFGVCRFGRRTIELSGPLVDVNDRAKIENTVRHEIAHALAGPGKGHGPEWKRQCAVTGAVPKACTEGESAPARWVGTCPACDLELQRHRLTRSARNGACPDCCRKAGGFDARYRLRWTDTHAEPADVPVEVAADRVARPAPATGKQVPLF